VPSPTNATNATYDIYDGTAASGTLLGGVTVNQTPAPVGTSDGGAQFQELGDYYPTTGTLTVVLNAQSANGTVVADAVGIAPAWATAGGQSVYESEPSYQESVQSTGYRTTPDVSFDGSDATGVTCYQDGSIEYDYFGTSLAAPCWAGLIAIADQGRVANGSTSFNSPSNPIQTLQALYSLPAGDFNAITSGYNGLSAGTGYDELTGLGSPIANLLVPALATYGLTSSTATQVVITTQPATSVTAGSAFGLTVTVEDSQGDVVTGYSGSVTIALFANPGSATLGGTVTVNVVDGVATFTDLTLTAADSGYTLVATSGSLTAATSIPFTVTPAAAAELTIVTQPSATATAGQPFDTQPLLDLEDRYGNLETGDDSTVVTAELMSGTGPLQGSITATVVGGVATFSNLADDKAGTITLIFATNSLQSPASSAIVISPAAASQLVVQTQPSPSATAGQAFATQPVIEEEDQFGNVETSDDSTVLTATLASGTGPLAGSINATVSGGVATFSNLADDEAGAITLSFGSSRLQSRTSSAVVISPAAASQLVVQTQPSTSATAGQAFATQPVIEEEDRYGNLETGDFATSVSVRLNSGTGALLGSTSATVSGGVATFLDLAEDKVGSITLKFTGGSLTPALATAVTIVPATATTLVVTGAPPSSVTAGIGFAIMVTAFDPFANIATSFTGRITASLASSPGGVALSGVLTVSAVDGVATFAGLTLDTAAASFSLRATGAGLAAAVTTAINVTPGPAAQLVVTSQPPASVEPDNGFGLTIAAVDRFGNVVTSESGDVAVALVNTATGTLAGKSTASFVDGIATIAGLTLNQAGVYSVQISANGLASAVATSVTVTPPPTITGEQVLTTGKGKHKMSIGFELFFSAPLDASRAGNPANYTVTQTVKHGHKTSVKPVAIRAAFNSAANSVGLFVIGSAPFTYGGQIVVNASASSGIIDTSGTAVDGNDEGVPGDNAVLVILKKDKGVV
jgi:hypothetical protein